LLKMGCSRLPMMFQDLLGPSKRVSNSVLVTPKEPVSAMRGKRRALASPMFAVAAARSCSAARTSGRRSSRAEGSPAGTVLGSFCSSIARPRGMAPGLWPRSTESSFSLRATRRSMSKTTTSTRRNSATAWRRSISGVRPPSKRSVASCTDSFRDSMVRWAISSRRSKSRSSKYAVATSATSARTVARRASSVPRNRAFWASDARRMRPKKSSSQDRSAVAE
jgi:hypothetical protein